MHHRPSRTRITNIEEDDDNEIYSNSKFKQKKAKNIEQDLSDNETQQEKQRRKKLKQRKAKDNDEENEITQPAKTRQQKRKVIEEYALVPDDESQLGTYENDYDNQDESEKQFQKKRQKKKRIVEEYALVEDQKMSNEQDSKNNYDDRQILKKKKKKEAEEYALVDDEESPDKQNLNDNYNDRQNQKKNQRKKKIFEEYALVDDDINDNYSNKQNQKKRQNNYDKEIPAEQDSSDDFNDQQRQKQRKNQRKKKIVEEYALVDDDNEDSNNNYPNQKKNQIKKKNNYNKEIPVEQDSSDDFNDQQKQKQKKNQRKKKIVEEYALVDDDDEDSNNNYPNQKKSQNKKKIAYNKETIDDQDSSDDFNDQQKQKQKKNQRKKKIVEEYALVDDDDEDSNNNYSRKQNQKKSQNKKKNTYDEEISAEQDSSDEEQTRNKKDKLVNQKRKKFVTEYALVQNNNKKLSTSSSYDYFDEDEPKHKKKIVTKYALVANDEPPAEDATVVKNDAKEKTDVKKEISQNDMQYLKYEQSILTQQLKKLQKEKEILHFKQILDAIDSRNSEITKKIDETKDQIEAINGQDTEGDYLNAITNDQKALDDIFTKINEFDQKRSRYWFNLKKNKGLFRAKNASDFYPIEDREEIESDRIKLINLISDDIINNEKILKVTEKEISKINEEFDLELEKRNFETLQKYNDTLETIDDMNANDITEYQTIYSRVRGYTTGNQYLIPYYTPNKLDPYTITLDRIYTENNLIDTQEEVMAEQYNDMKKSYSFTNKKWKEMSLQHKLVNNLDTDDELPLKKLNHKCKKLLKAIQDYSDKHNEISASFEQMSSQRIEFGSQNKIEMNLVYIDENSQNLMSSIIDYVGFINSAYQQITYLDDHLHGKEKGELDSTQRYNSVIEELEKMRFGFDKSLLKDKKISREIRTSAKKAHDDFRSLLNKKFNEEFVRNRVDMVSEDDDLDVLERDEKNEDDDEETSESETKED